jgi:transposase
MSTMAERKPKRQRRNFTDDFKAGAIRLVLDEGRSVATVARDLDLTESSLRNWVEQAKANAGRGRPGALTTVEREELTRLRRENRILQEEREILKKAAAFFAKERR